jgi:nucleotide-binding universal stress UspA family protein
MLEIQRILVSTDFSKQSESAESRAALLCKELQLDALNLLTIRSASLSDMLANVLKSSRAEQRTVLVHQALQDLRNTKARIESEYGIHCNYTVRFGDAALEVSAASESKSADMIVIGELKRNYFEKLLNTAADTLIRMTTRPVLLVRNEPVDSYREVLVPVDFSPESRHAAKLALKIAPKAHIVFLHAYRVWAEGQMRDAGIDDEIINNYRVRYGQKARQELNQFIEELGPMSQLISRVVQLGWAAPVISSYAKRREPDLIVLGRHSGSRVEEFLIGSVTRRTIDETTSDILVTPRKDPGNDYWYEKTAA